RPWFALGAITRRGTSIGMALPWPNARETPMQRGKCKDSLKIYDVGARHSVPPTSPPCQFFSTPWQTGQHHKPNQISHLPRPGHQFATFLRQLVPRLAFLSPTLLFLSKPSHDYHRARPALTHPSHTTDGIRSHTRRKASAR